MTEGAGVLLDMPFVAALAHPPEFCVTRRWGPYPTLIHDSPRYRRLDALKSEALEALLLFEEILLPDIFVGLYDREESGKVVLVGRELAELQDLARDGHISFVDPPPMEDALDRVPFDAEFARSTKHILWADACRDLGPEERMRSWEYDFLVDLVTSEAERELDSIVFVWSEAEREIDASGQWILEGEITRGAAVEEDDSRYSFFSDLVPLQAKARRRHLRNLKKHRKEFLRVIAAAYRSFDQKGRLKGWSDTEIGVLEGKRCALKWSFARITQLVRMAAQRDVALKLEVPIDVRRPSKARDDVRLEGTGLAILPVIMDEIQRFPRLDSVADLKKHLGKRYVSDLREALLQWKDALLTGALRDEQALRREIRKCADTAIKKVGRWRSAGLTLTVISLVAGGLSSFAPALGLLGMVLGRVSLLSGVAVVETQLREGAIRESKGWLLFGSER